MPSRVQIIDDVIHWDSAPVARMIPGALSPSMIDPFTDLIDGLSEDDLVKNEERSSDEVQDAVTEKAERWVEQIEEAISAKAKAGFVTVDEVKDILGDFQFKIECE